MDYEIVRTERTAIQARGISPDPYGRWLSFVGKSQKTQETYTRAIKQFAKYVEANGITAPHLEDIRAYKDRLIADGKKPTTVNAYLIAVKLFFQWTASEGLYPDVASRVEKVKLDDNFKHDYLTSRQAGKLLKSVNKDSEGGLRDYAIIALMVTCGLRTIEVVRANVEDMRTAGDSMALYLQGKGHTERTEYVKLPEPVEDAIRQYLSIRGNTQGNAPLFTSVAHRNSGERMTTKSVSRIAKESLETAHLKTDRITAHSLRHTAAVINLTNGGTLEETQSLLRHKSESTTRIYSHLVERQNNNSEYRIAKAIFG